MVKIVFCLHRLPHLTREQFQHRWRSVHAPLVAAHAATLEEDGQYDKAAFQLQKAESEMVKTHDDIFLRENNTPLTWSLQRDTVTPY